MSRSLSARGAVIEGDVPDPHSDPIDVIVVLPAAGCLVGRGRLVRGDRPSPSDPHSSFVVAVERFRIEPRDAVLRDYTPVLHGC